MPEVKYIIVEVMEIETPIVFSDLIQHKTIAQGMGKVIAAGFIAFGAVDGMIGIQCYGESISLGIKSREREDVDIIQRHLNLC
jgi:hypothetical protein